VHVHVHAVGCDVDEERIRRLPPAVQHVLVGGAHAVRDELVAHVAAVDPHVLLVGTRPRRLRRARAALDAQHAEVQRDRAAVRDEVVAQHVDQARLGRAPAPLLRELAVVPQREGHIGPRERMAAQRLDAVRELGGLGLQELAARGRAEEELAHFDARAHAARRGRQLARACVQALRMRGIGRAAGDGQVGDRGDGGQRLAAKAHRGHALQVGQRGDLAGRVAAQRQRQFAGRDAAPIVLDHDGADAAGQQAHGDFGGARIERVVHQLAHDRRRPLHHFAGGDLAHQLVGQLADRTARGGRGIEDCIHRSILGAADNPPPWTSSAR
jgi:hypothetical protein